MTFLLFLGVVALATMLFGLRARMTELERRLHALEDGETMPRATAAAAPPGPARIVPDMPSPPPSQPAAAETAPAPAEDVPGEDAPEVSPAPAPIAEASAAPPAIVAVGPTSRRATNGFEDVFGRKLPIWAGGITLAIAGVLLVKYSIDAGLLSPPVRVLLGLVFGGGLIGGAELARRNPERAGDPRIHQALAGAGIASLYAAILAAANLYALIGGGTAFAALAVVTLLAMALSLRFGAPSAILGLAGGLAAPALVSAGAPNVPLLSAYLALALGGLTALSRRQRWLWLGVAALIGGAGWALVLIVLGTLDAATTVSLGLLTLVLGLALPWFGFSGARGGIVRAVGAVVAAAEIALIVAKGGFAPLQWGFYLLLSAALAWLAARDAAYRPLTPVGLAVGLLLAALWPAPPAAHLALVLAALGLAYAGPALWRLWRVPATLIEAGQIAGFALAGAGVALLHYHLADGTRDGLLALLMLLFAGLPMAGAGLGWANAERREDARFALLVVAAALLVGLASFLGLPHWLLSVGLSALAAALLLLGTRAGDSRLGLSALVFLAGGLAVLLALFGDATALAERRLLAGGMGPPYPFEGLLRWGAVAAAMALATRHLAASLRPWLQGVAAFLVYGCAAQIVPGEALAILSGALLLGSAEAFRRRPTLALEPALGVDALLVFLWIVWPLARWAIPATVSLAGVPMLAAGLPSLGEVLRQLALPVLLAAAALHRARPLLPFLAVRIGTVLLAATGVVAAHLLYKPLFHLMTPADVAMRGLAERTLWEALLLAGGFGALRLKRPRLAMGLAIAALLHSLWYSLLLHDPLWTRVVVGPWPVVNLLLPAFAVPMGALWLIGRSGPGHPLCARLIDVGRMVLIILFALAGLRQIFCGPVLAGVPVGPVENIGWSVLAILLAIGFLVWGIRRGLHDWRIASLLLMLAAVAKVFLLDAAGLEGLLRIASFLALGFSLIGLGWLYSRFLRQA